jgi:hypothetical protein
LSKSDQWDQVEQPEQADTKAMESNVMLRRNTNLMLLSICMIAALFVSIRPDSPDARATQTVPQNAGNAATNQAAKQNFIALSEDSFKHQGDNTGVISLADLSDNPSINKTLRLRSVGFQDGTATSIRFDVGQPLFSVSENGRVTLKSIDHVEMGANKLAYVFRRTPKNQSEIPVHAIEASTLSQTGESIDRLTDLLAGEDVAKQLGLAPGAKFESPNENMDVLLSDIKSEIRNATGINDFEFTDEQIAQITGKNAQGTSGTLPSFHYKPVTDPESGTISTDLIIDSGQEKIVSLNDNGELSFHGLEKIIVTEDRVAFVVRLDHDKGAAANDASDASQTANAVAGGTCTLHTSIRGDGSTLVVCLGDRPNGSQCGFPTIQPVTFPIPLPGGGFFILTALILTCPPC